MNLLGRVEAGGPVETEEVEIMRVDPNGIGIIKGCQRVEEVIQKSRGVAAWRPS